MIDDKQVVKAFERLEQKNIDTSIINQADFSNKQIMVLCRGLERHQDITNINNPNISSKEMENILDDEFDMGLKLQLEHGLDPQKYKIRQLYELNDALNKGFDITPYKSPEFSANHMFVAQTYQENNLPLDEFSSQASLTSLIDNRNTLLREAQDNKINSIINNYDPNHDRKVEALNDYKVSIYDIDSQIWEKSLAENGNFGDLSKPLVVDCFESHRRNLLASGLSPEFVDGLGKFTVDQFKLHTGSNSLEYVSVDTSPSRIKLINAILTTEHYQHGPTLSDYNEQQLAVLETALENNILPNTIYGHDPQTTSAKAYGLLVNEKFNIDSLSEKFVLIDNTYLRTLGTYPVDINNPPCTYIEFNTTEDVLALLQSSEDLGSTTRISELQNTGKLELSNGETLYITDSPDKIGQALIEEQSSSGFKEVLPVKDLELSKTYDKQLAYKEAIQSNISTEINKILDSQLNKPDTHLLINWQNGAVKSYTGEKEALAIKAQGDDLVKANSSTLEKYAAQKFKEKGKEFERTSSSRVDDGLAF